MEKNFKKNPTEFFISDDGKKEKKPDTITYTYTEKEQEPAADPEQEPEKKPRYSHRRNAADDFTPPPGYTLRPEPKTARISVLCTEQIYNGLTYSAKVYKKSRNELINDILRNYLIDEGLIKDE